MLAKLVLAGGPAGPTTAAAPRVLAVPTAALELKERGNHAFKLGQYAQAVGDYSEALSHLERTASDPAQATALRAVLLSNRAAAKLSAGADLSDCVADCTAALRCDPDNLKAYMRRAMASEQLEKCDDASLFIHSSAQLSQSSVFVCAVLTDDQWRQVQRLGH
jgi:Flp pilus assembly protein TadD